MVNRAFAPRFNGCCAYVKVYANTGPKSGPQSRALSGTVCVLSIADGTFTN